MRQGTDAELTVERQVSMRYKGQGWEIPVRLETATFDEFAAEQLAARFTKAYEEFFGRAIDDLAIEAVSWSVRVASITALPPPDGLAYWSRASPIVDPVTGTRPIYDPVAADDGSQPP